MPLTHLNYTKNSCKWNSEYLNPNCKREVSQPNNYTSNPVQGHKLLEKKNHVEIVKDTCSEKLHLQNTQNDPQCELVGWLVDGI